MFKQELYKTSWDNVINNKNPNDAYNYFLHKLIVLYDKYFPKQNIGMYKKDLQSPWITRGIKKSSKRKQKLYVQFLKNRSSKNEFEYRNYKILKHKNNIKKAWDVIKESIGKTRCNNQNVYPKKKSY